MEQTETQGDLNIGIGDKESEKLKPETVKIARARIEKVGEKGTKKIVCIVVYPGREETIDISSVKYLRNDKIVETGLWYNIEKKESDEEPDKLQKNSSLAIFMQALKADTIADLEGKDAVTVDGEKGYLCFKAY